MAHDLIQRLKSAARILLKGQTQSAQREIPAITFEEVAEAKLFFPLEKFFIFGHARSGTTLLTRLVRLHPQVHCNYQAHFFTRPPLLESLVASEEIEHWLARHSNRWNRGRDLSPVVLRAASDFIMERDARQAGKGAPGCVVGDKSPNSLQDGEAVRLMVKVYPDARLIFIVRDGRDAIVSHRFQTFIDRPHQLSPAGLKIRQDFIDHPEPFFAGGRSVFTDEELHQAAEGWAHNVIDTDRAARSLLGDHYYSLHYEDMISHSWENLGNLWGFLGVDSQIEGLHEALQDEMGRNPDAAWQQRKSAQIAASIQKGQRGTWREMFTSRDRQIFKQAAGETLIAWGYETDLEW